MKIAITLLLMALNSVSIAQSVGQSTSEDSTAISYFISAEPVSEQDHDDSLNEAKTGSTPGRVFFFRTRVAMRPLDPAKPSQGLGNGSSVLVSFILQPTDRLLIRYSGKKDRYEPIRWSSSPRWTGFELNRISAIHERHRWRLFLGSYRINHGFRLATGSTFSVQAKSNPVWQPRALSSISGYAGSSSFPTRRGVALEIRSRFRMYGFASHSHHPASIASQRADTGLLERRIVDVSSTSVFQSVASLSRRSTVRVRALGFGVSRESGASGVAIHFESIRATGPTQRAFRTNHRSVSITNRLSFRRITVVAEGATSKLALPTYRASLRHDSGKRGVFLIDITRTSGNSGFLFGGDRRFSRSVRARRTLVLGWKYTQRGKQTFALGLMSRSTLLPNFPYRKKRISTWFYLSRTQNRRLKIDLASSFREEQATFSEPLVSSSHLRLRITYSLRMRTRVTAETQYLSTAEKSAEKGSTLLTKWGISSYLGPLEFVVSTALVTASGDSLPVFFGKPTVQGAFPVTGLFGSGHRNSVLIRTPASKKIRMELSYSESVMLATEKTTSVVTLQLTHRR